MLRRREPRRSMIIIGAGIGGLAAGIYARLNGYEATILEMHDRPGGLCTSWERRGYMLDHCIHDLSGCSRGTRMNNVWQDLGALADAEIVHRDEFTRVELEDGESFTFHSSIGRFEEEMLRLAPEDSRLIRSLVRGARRLRGIDLEDLAMGRAGLRMLPLLPTYLRFGRMSLEELAQRFSSPVLRRAVPTLQYDMDDVPAIVTLSFLASLDRGDMGWPKGGSTPFARGMEERFLELDGIIEYGSKVLEVLVEDGSAVGVVTEDGTRYYADMVISAADGRTTLYSMLPSLSIDKEVREYYDHAPDRQAFTLGVFLGVAEDLSREPRSMVMFLDRPIVIEGVSKRRLKLEFHTHDSGLAPWGRTLIKATMAGSHSYWAKMREEGRYDEAKGEVAEAVISALEGQFPWIRERIEVTDVITPLTVERYTGNHHGLQAWPARNALRVMRKGLTATLPELRNFYMVGQWAHACGGLSIVALRSRDTIRRICREDGKRFIP